MYEVGPLEGVDDVDWSSVEDAYGAAVDVPGLLRLLWSGSESERNEALNELFSNIWQQSTVYDATSTAVPFLVPRATSRANEHVRAASR